jgi:peptide/nickel transport system substrate-binding protein/oligopeptide transport system substrate-binding protein
MFNHGFPATVHAASPHASGGILRIADEGESDLTSIDPPNPQASDAQSDVVENLVFGGLVRLDNHLQVQPDAASSWTVSDGGKVYTFTLRPGLKWGDGTPVTAQDVVWSFNRAFSPANKAGLVSFYLAHIVGGAGVTNGKAKTVSGIQAIGADKVRFTLDQPAAVFLNDLAYAVSFLVPRQQVEKYGNSWTEHVAATGPFIVKQWKHNQEIDLVPNPYYWRGKPKLAGVNVEFIQNTETAYNLYKTGGLDVMGLVNFPGNHLKDVQGTPDYHTGPQLFTEFLTINLHHKPFDNPLVRQAFSYAINRSTVATLINNRFLPAHGMLPPGMPGYNKSLVGQTFDPTKAQQLLARAGYPGGKGFPKVTLNVDGGDTDGQTKAVAYQEFWKRVLGVTVQLNQLEHGAYINALTNKNYDLASIQWGADYPDPQDFLSLIFQTGAGANNGGYSNPQFDKLTEQADVMPHGSPDRYQKYQQAEQIMLNDAAGIMILWGKSNVLINPRVHGLSLTALGGGFLLIPANWADVTIS